MKFIIFIALLLSFQAFAQGSKPKSVRYEYKKFEKFDFDEIGVEGEAGSPGDLSITPRARNEFRNKLPERMDFNREMKKAVEVIR
ncbi:MAG: hypothetical protein V4598_16805 [Bdellovibrionota bacterium]